MENPKKLFSQLTKRLAHLDRRLLILLLLPAASVLLLLLSTAAASGRCNPFAYLNDLDSIFLNGGGTSYRTPTPVPAWNRTGREAELIRSRIAVCLVGGARRFELTGPSIVQKVLEAYPNADLFLNSPLDSDSYKFSLLKTAPRIAAVRVFEPDQVPETEPAVRVLTASNSPNGIQGLLQYFNLVEGCLTMIQAYQLQQNFTYNWILRTRVDGYWSTRLRPELFIPGQYVVPTGSSYGGLNDRFGLGDLATSVAALSRLSLLPYLDSAGFRELNSESAFQAQLTTRNVSFLRRRVPFCVVSDRRYDFPPGRFGVPVTAMTSKAALSGAKCRPCARRFSGGWAAAVVRGLDREWSWVDAGGNGNLQLCDASGEWEDGWGDIFDAAAGKRLAAARKRVSALSLDECVADFEEMKRRAAVWDVPPAMDVCRRSKTLRKENGI